MYIGGAIKYGKAGIFPASEIYKETKKQLKILKNF